MAKPVVIFGTGDLARCACVYLGVDSPHEVAAFTVHRQYLKATELLGKPIVPFEELVANYPPDRFAMFVAVGYSKINKNRAEVYDACKALGYELITYVSSKAALISRAHVEIGDNCFIFDENTIQPFVKIGNDVILWSGNHVGHDSTIGDHCFVASHAVISGNVKIGPYCFVGVNATFRDGVTVGAESVIGAGALILKDVAPQSVFKGPAGELSPVPSSRLKL